MSDCRLCKKMLKWDVLIGGSQAKHVHKLFQGTGCEELYILKEKVDTKVLLSSSLKRSRLLRFGLS